MSNADRYRMKTDSRDRSSNSAANSLSIVPNSAASPSLMTRLNSLISLTFTPTPLPFRPLKPRFSLLAGNSNVRGSTLPQPGKLNSDDLLVGDMSLQNTDVAGELVHAGHELR